MEHNSSNKDSIVKTFHDSLNCLDPQKLIVDGLQPLQTLQ